jgi:uroporphyrinogen decarboxylase
MTGLNQEPLLLRAARGESVERTPVWMMRQAGRYMKVYRDLREKYPSFRERSENPDLAIEISLQPWKAFRPDGVIMFSDILTPLTGMGIPFDIVESKGPMIDPPIRSQAQIDAVHELDPDTATPYIHTLMLNSKIGFVSILVGLAGIATTVIAIFAQ